MSLETVKKLKPCKFTWNDNKYVKQDNKIHFGFIAQDIEKIFTKHKFGIVYEMEDGIMKIRYAEVIPILVKAIQELEEKVTILELKK